MKNRRFHPIAAILPLLDEPHLAELSRDIAANGLQVPIVVDASGAIIDGRNRYIACHRVGVQPHYETWDYQGSLLAFVLSLNLHRRHLDESQRSLIAARLANLKLGDNQHKQGTPIDGPISQPEAGKLLNVGTRGVQRGRVVLERGAPELIAAVDAGKIAVSAAAQIAERSKEQQRAAVDRVIRLNERAPSVVREMNRQDRFGELIEAGTPSIGGLRRAAVVLADPPWRYDANATSPAYEVANHYPTMLIEEICALALGDMTLKDCVLFLWTPSPMLRKAMMVVEAWGFAYQTSAVWDKQLSGRRGLGYYFTIHHELLLVATKGRPPKPAPSARVSSLIRAPRGAHSVKPPIVHAIIERMYPGLPKLELFQRGAARRGWMVWGNQANAAA